jgi:hypothetical protein
MLQDLVVAMIVLGAAGYAAHRLAPAPWRRAGAELAGRVARRYGLAESRAARIEASLSSAAGCSNCSTCKACGTAGDASAAPTDASSIAQQMR